MITQIKTVFRRSPLDFLEDLLGVSSLFFLLMVGLSLPGLY